MNRFCAIILTTAAVMLAGGCGGGGGGGNSGLKEGDILVVTQALEREKFEASYGEVMETPKGPDFKIDHTDGDIIELAVGTELEVIVPPKSDSKVIVVKLSKSADGLTGEELKEKFVPERFRTPDFLYYRISLKSEYLGNQIKKKE